LAAGSANVGVTPIYRIRSGVNVRMKSDGKWAVFIDKLDSRKNRTFGPGRDNLVRAIRAAELIAQEFNKLSKGYAVKPKDNALDPVFKDYSKVWLDQNTGRWDPYTTDRYGTILRLHIWPYEYYNRPMSEISRKDIKNHLRAVLKDRSPNTVEAVHGVVSGIFNEAIDDDLIGANPATGLLKRVLPPKNQRDLKDPDPFDLKDRDRFLAYAEAHFSLPEQLVLKMMVFAGLRLGEALAMRLENFYPDTKQYFVAQSFRQKRFKKPKFGKTRFVDLPDFLVQELKEYITMLRKGSLAAGRGGRVDLLFIDPTENGGPWPYSQRKVQRLVERVCKKAGLRVRNPHDLRHTYASILLMAHQSPAYVQKQLGHSSISITVDTYGHWIDGAGREGLEEALGAVKVVRNRGEKLHFTASKQKGPQQVAETLSKN
jgi:integrase